MNSLVKLAASALPGEKKYVLVAGAGVSKDAGVPTAWDLMMTTAALLWAADNPDVRKKPDIGKWFLESEYAQMEYAQLIGQIYSKCPDQQSFLDKHLSGHPIGESHKAIAELARRGIIRAVITTNFDAYIEEALRDAAVKVQVIANTEDLRFSEPLIHCKTVRVYKPHGDLGKGALRNTPHDLEKLPKQMENELIRVVSEHGVIVLGYAGRDGTLQRVFSKRDHSHYPLFWVNPEPLSDGLVLANRLQEVIYIPCTGAADILRDCLNLYDRLNDIVPSGTQIPTIANIRLAFERKRDDIQTIYVDFLSNAYKELEAIRPDFSKFEHRDDAIVDQIDKGTPISRDIVASSYLACRHANDDAITSIYDFFGQCMYFYDNPSGFSGPSTYEDYDGYQYLLYEMFVAFVGELIKWERWNSLGKVLSKDLYCEEREERGKSTFMSFTDIEKYNRSLDIFRKRRLQSRQPSLMADMIAERFSQGPFSEFITHREFIDADYFLFLATLRNHTEGDRYALVWRPRSCIYLKNVPRFLIRSQSREYLEKVAKAAGYTNADSLINALRKHHFDIGKLIADSPFPHDYDPLTDEFIGKLGSR